MSVLGVVAPWIDSFAACTVIVELDHPDLVSADLVDESVDIHAVGGFGGAAEATLADAVSSTRLQCRVAADRPLVDRALEHRAVRRTTAEPQPRRGAELFQFGEDWSKAVGKTFGIRCLQIPCRIVPEFDVVIVPMQAGRALAFRHMRDMVKRRCF